jgi:hypothetical protein
VRDDARTARVGITTGEEHHVSANSRDRERVIYSVSCQECESSSGLRWQGWRAYRADDPETGEPPTLAFYCPTCAEREFGPTPGR